MSMFGWFVGCCGWGGIILVIFLVAIAGVFTGILGYFLSKKCAETTLDSEEALYISIFGLVLFLDWYAFIGSSLLYTLSWGWIIFSIILISGIGLVSSFLLIAERITFSGNLRSKNLGYKIAMVISVSGFFGFFFFSFLWSPEINLTSFTREERAAWWAKEKIMPPKASAGDAREGLKKIQEARPEEFSPYFMGLGYWKAKNTRKASEYFNKYMKSLPEGEWFFFEALTKYLSSDYPSAIRDFRAMGEWEFVVVSRLKYDAMKILDDDFGDHLNDRDLKRISSHNLFHLKRIRELVSLTKPKKRKNFAIKGKIPSDIKVTINSIMIDLVPRLDADLMEIVKARAPELKVPPVKTTPRFYWFSLVVFLTMMYAGNFVMRDYVAAGKKFDKEFIWIKAWFLREEKRARGWILHAGKKFWEWKICERVFQWHQRYFWRNVWARKIAAKIRDLELRPGLFTHEIEKITNRRFPLDVLSAWYYWRKVQSVVVLDRLTSEERKDIKSLEKAVNRLSALLVKQVDEETFDIVIALRGKNKELTEKYLKGEMNYVECRVALFEVIDQLRIIQDIFQEGTSQYTHYDFLGLKPGALNNGDLKESYRAIMLAIHPDRHSNNRYLTELSQRVTQAYNTLKDPEKKELYDQMMGFKF